MSLLRLKKVLVSDKISSVCLDVFKDTGVEVTYSPGLSKTDLIDIIPEYNGLIVRSATKVNADVIRAAKNLEIIGRAGTGTDNIDHTAASAAGVVVMNTPGGNTISAAEHTCALLMASCRNLANRHAELMLGEWNRINGIELRGKTLGIVGLGQIGMVVAHRMQAFGMKTVGYDPIVPAEKAAEHDVEFLKLDDLWPVCDFITIHVPLLPSTKHLINSSVFASCKTGVRIVNCARGGVVDEAALLESLNSGKVACAALDVFEEEPPASDSPLLQHSNLIATPHLGASTAEAQVRVAKEIAEQFLALRDGKSSFGCLNAPLLRSALGEPSQAKLAQKLGGLLHTLEPNASVIGVSGDQNPCLPYAVMAGYLNAKGIDSANLISIKNIAEANNLSFEFIESNEDLTVSYNDTKLSGIADGNTAYLTKINNVHTRIPLAGEMTVVKAGPPLFQLLPTLSPALNGVYFAGTLAILSHTDGLKCPDLEVLGSIKA